MRRRRCIRMMLRIGSRDIDIPPGEPRHES